MQALLFFILMISLTNTAFGQLLRNFPIDSQAGKLTKFEYPMVVISKQTLYLSAGSQIKNKNNLIVMPSMLDEKGSVRYQIDAMGNVHRIWFLTSKEAELARIEQNGNSNKLLEFIKKTTPF